MYLCVSLLKKEYSSIQIVNMRMIVGFIFNSFFCKINDISIYSKEAPYLKLLILRGLLGGISMTCVFTCLTLMKISDGVVMINTNPIWTNFLAICFLGEHFSKKSLLFCLVSFIGIVFVSRPSFLFDSSEN